VDHPDVDSGDVAAPPGIAETPPVAAVPSPQPSAQELTLLTPPRVGQPDVESGNEMPMPREAARRLARFLDEVRVERATPLIASPPRQRVRAKRPLLVQHRSTWTAAQPLAQPLGIAPPAATASPAPKGILDDLRSGTLSSRQVEALDALFPAFNGRACELFVDDP
jgi:hypothetical protein